ncbi:MULTISPECIES: LLM class F420-dependent oxidoreductase [unclassified Sphingomonas]|uniref:LLM class F420-dependent oxidoreductase n=1 Tax=unclassified Sphingomonas TaxID=196159 RepID=UPI0006F59517|nr:MULTISPECIES: LLM class F420-dependent oxidoreductase [unclassified Sphingomonas]KQX17446.1 LLM class F420-dependent oxidoreductase [Sphingomonas sp. Root1294]KQY70371.1 LLM class F420-dependent oxidoreductase [Sphingomonas sp. Root50]KRB92142.1 LLM class F420-dependent oxidoreductase [Sphingomonas sp. Root720]
MRISMALGLNQFDTPTEFMSVEAIREMAGALERAGIDACYVTDHPAPSHAWLAAGGHSALDPFVQLTAVAAVSTRLKLHTQIVVLPYRNPFLTAKAAASLDVISGGRMIMGVGVGYMKAEFAALGVPFEKRGALVDEALQAMKLAWTGESVSFAGQLFDAQEVQLLPLPVQRPHPPIWCGGNSEKAIRRAVQYCDGWAPFPARGKLSAITGTDQLTSVAELADKIAFARDLCAEQGRTRPFDVCMVPFDMTLYNGTRLNAQAIIDQLEELAAAGVTWSAVALPQADRAQYVENVLWFGEEVLAKIGGRQAATA